MDKNANGVIELSDIKGTYSAKKHPDVMMGKKSEDEVLYEFLDTFEGAYALKHPEAKLSGKRVITMEEWLEYYNTISCSIDNDQYFELMMTNAYNLGNAPAAKQAWGGALWSKHWLIPIVNVNLIGLQGWKYEIQAIHSLTPN